MLETGIFLREHAPLGVDFPIAKLKQNYVDIQPSERGEDVPYAVEKKTNRLDVEREAMGMNRRGLCGEKAMLLSLSLSLSFTLFLSGSGRMHPP